MPKKIAKKLQSVQEERLLSTQAAADKIGVHLRTLYRYLARGIVAEPAQDLQRTEDSIYRGKFRQWNAAEIELARVAIKAYRDRVVSQGKQRRVGGAGNSMAPAKLLTTKEVLEILKVTQRTLDFICGARSEERWGRGARLPVAARNRYASRLFDPRDVRKWFEYMMERNEKFRDLAVLQKLDGTPLFSSSYPRFDLASLLREILDSRGPDWTGTKART
jgi:hypothetical protein